MSALLARSTEAVLGLFRLVVGLLLLCHGAATLFGLFGGGHGATPAVFQWPGWWAAAIQLTGGALLMLGLAARPAALVCSGSMAYAYFTVHQPQALLPLQNGGEPAVLFCWACLLLLVLGPGAYSVDAALATRRVSPPAPEPSGVAAS
ncbi:DoxX family protein [Streptomyces sp. NPDC059740]|uniref:DoxX family protein n=1 Tax=Streptomyces sp. NPDC059740 TaxID=3346926 RepID=UPI00365D057A